MPSVEKLRTHQKARNVNPDPISANDTEVSDCPYVPGPVGVVEAPTSAIENELVL
jgi:hypothetical protein